MAFSTPVPSIILGFVWQGPTTDEKTNKLASRVDLLFKNRQPAAYQFDLLPPPVPSPQFLWFTRHPPVGERSSVGHIRYDTLSVPIPDVNGLRVKVTYLNRNPAGDGVPAVGEERDTQEEVTVPVRIPDFLEKNIQHVLVILASDSMPAAYIVPDEERLSLSALRQSDLQREHALIRQLIRHRDRDLAERALLNIAPAAPNDMLWEELATSYWRTGDYVMAARVARPISRAIIREHILWGIVGCMIQEEVLGASEGVPPDLTTDSVYEMHPSSVEHQLRSWIERYAAKPMEARVDVEMLREVLGLLQHDRVRHMALVRIIIAKCTRHHQVEAAEHFLPHIDLNSLESSRVIRGVLLEYARHYQVDRVGMLVDKAPRVNARNWFCETLLIDYYGEVLDSDNRVDPTDFALLLGLISDPSPQRIHGEQMWIRIQAQQALRAGNWDLAQEHIGKITDGRTRDALWIRFAIGGLRWETEPKVRMAILTASATSIQEGPAKQNFFIQAMIWLWLSEDTQAMRLAFTLAEQYMMTLEVVTWRDIFLKSFTNKLLENERSERRADRLIAFAAYMHNRWNRCVFLIHAVIWLWREDAIDSARTILAHMEGTLPNRFKSIIESLMRDSRDMREVDVFVQEMIPDSMRNVVLGSVREAHRAGPQAYSPEQMSALEKLMVPEWAAENHFRPSAPFSYSQRNEEVSQIAAQLPQALPASEALLASPRAALLPVEQSGLWIRRESVRQGPSSWKR